MTRPSSVVTGLMVMGVVLYWGWFIRAVMELLDAGALTPDLRRGLAVPAFIGLAFLIYTIIRMIPKPAEQAIEFTDQGVRLPVRRSRRTDEVPYEAVNSIHVAGRPPRRVAVIGGGDRAYVFHELEFVAPDAMNRFIMELRLRIRGLERGDEQLSEIDHKVRFTQAVLSRQPRVTEALLILIGIAFAIQIAFGAIDDPFKVVRLGANSGVLIADGQYFRLVTANFLHGNFVHLFLNSVALHQVGGLVERMVGHSRYIVLYLIGGIAGAATSAAWGVGLVSLGASTSIFAVLGGFFVLNFRYRGRLPAGIKQSVPWWIFILGLSAALPLVLPQIDAGAHIGGFVMGVVIMLVSARGSEPAALLVSRPSSPLLIAAVFSVLITLLGIGVGVARGLSGGEEDEGRVLSAYIQRPDATAPELNDLAWHIVIQPDASRRRLELALAAAARAVELWPGDAAVTDTLATSHFRLGAFDKAVTLERDLLFKRATLEFPTQLARFERARFERDGQMVFGTTSTIAVSATLSARVEGVRTLTISVAEPFPQGGSLDLVVSHKDELIGLAHVKLGPRGAGDVIYKDGGDQYLLWRGDSQIDATVVDTRTSTLAPGAAEFTFWGMDETVTKLPGFTVADPI